MIGVGLQFLHNQPDLFFCFLKKHAPPLHSRFLSSHAERVSKSPHKGSTLVDAFQIIPPCPDQKDFSTPPRPTEGFNQDILRNYQVQR